ncbi:MAG: citramalate synthase [Bacteroidota bacterium]
MGRVVLYDTTLRDGTQGEGVFFSVDDKIRVLRRLDDLGLDYVEGGWPGANPRDLEFFSQAARIPLRHAKLTAFGSTRRPRNRPEDDPVLLNLLAAGTGTLAIFGKSWILHVTEVLRVEPAENLAMIEESVAYLKARGREVVYDAEHFFDGFAADPDYALATLASAARGGADWIVLCDTNGGTMPSAALAAIARARETVSVPLGVHIHNDSGMAVALSVLAAEAGVAQIQGTINGYGERCGNANLCSILPTLVLKYGLNCTAAPHLGQLTEVSRFVSELTNLHHDERQPYVGASAFAHKAGMHVDAVRKNPRTLEHVSPEAVGNSRRILLSDHASRSSILEKAARLYPNLTKDTPEVSALMEQLKELEHLGYQFEAAEASFELLMRKAFRDYAKSFALKGFRIIVEKHGDQPVFSEATIKVVVDGEEELTAAEGDGPVNALDGAIRKALSRFYPEIRLARLTDYKVRVLEENRGTAAKVRVLMQTSDGREDWGTVGVSENLIEASWQALVDSLDYYIERVRRDRTRAPDA